MVNFWLGCLIYFFVLEHPINQSTNAFNYQHMINQYIPGYQPPTSPNPNPIEDIIRNPNQSNNPKLEPTNPIWNKFWNSVPKNESIGKDEFSKKIHGVFEY